MEAKIIAGVLFSLDPTRPLYEQIVEQVSGALARGNLDLQTRMPSVRELAQLLKVNPNTVMRAYQDLERNGLLVTHKGQGTFTTSRSEMVNRVRSELAQQAIRQLAAAMKQLGFEREQTIALIEEVDW